MRDKIGDKARLQHILDAIAEIHSFTEDVDFEGFANSSIIKSACICQLEIVGEACNHLSKNLKDDNNDIAWHQIIRLRNFLIHQYFGVDEALVWDVIRQDLPALEDRAKELLKMV